MQPLTLCAYEVDIEPVVDTFDENQRRALGVKDSDIVCPCWEADMLAGAVPASQALADRLVAAGYAALLVRSFAVGAAAGDVNLVMWKWGEHRPHRVVLVDDESRLSGGSARL